MVFFARRVAHFTEVVDVAHPDEDTRVYAVRGPLFFASSNDLVYQFDYAGDPAHVVIDLSDVADLRLLHRRRPGPIELKYHQGKHVQIVGLNEPSRAWHSTLTGQLGGATDRRGPTGAAGAPSRLAAGALQIGRWPSAPGSRSAPCGTGTRSAWSPRRPAAPAVSASTPRDDVDRLRTIRRMKPLGFTLEEMRRLLASLHGARRPRRRRRTPGGAPGTFVADCHTRAEESCAHAGPPAQLRRGVPRPARRPFGAAPHWLLGLIVKPTVKVTRTSRWTWCAGKSGRR